MAIIKPEQLGSGLYNISGSFSGSFQGTHLGTSSYATNALSSSYALTASYLDNYIPPFPYTGSALITGSLGVTGSVSFRAQGALSTDIAFRIRNSADTSNLGVVLGDGTINLGTSNTNYTSTFLAGRVANIGSGNAGTYNTYAKLTSIGHDNLFTSYGFFINVGNSNNINANSGGRPVVIGEGNTLFGSSIVLGHGSTIASTSTSLGGNISVGINNTIQYEKTKTYLFGSNLRVSLAGGASMVKIGAASSTGTLSQINRSFELYLNETSGSDFFLSGNSNLVLKNNTVITAGTHYETAATNTNTIHSGISPITNIADAFQQYSADITAGNAAPHFRTEAGNIVKLYTQPAVTSSQGIADTLTNLGFLTGSSVINPTASFAITASYALNALSASYALSSSFASTVPASGVIGLNLSQIATASFTASVSPTQFTVTSASITEFTVNGTGTTIGNATTDTHRVTGSLAITGSTNITGPLTATQIGAGAAPSGSIPLDVRAQGALSTDIGFRVRDSANDRDNFQINGQGTATFRTNQFYNGIDLFSVGGSQLALRTYGGVGMIGTNGNGTINFNSTLASIGYGNHITPLARLDVKAQGALSTDVAFRVRNSADDRNFFSVLGNGDIEVRTNRVSLAQSRRISIGGNNTDNTADSNAYDEIVMLGYNNTNANFRTTILGSSNSCNVPGGSPALLVGYGNTSTTGGNIIIGKSNTGQASLILGANNTANGGGAGSGIFCIGNSNIISEPNGFPILPMFLIGTSVTLPNNSATNNCVFLSAGSGSGNPFVTIKNDNLLIGTLTPWTANFDNNSRGVFYTKNGTAPTTLPADSFAIYSADRNGTAGKASPHFRTEDGTIVWLGDESRLFNVTASRTIISSSQNTASGSSLTVYGSGSAQPVFTVQGSQGELFSITDSLSGSLFSVNDISGLPILEVFSDNTTLLGNYQDPMLITTAKVVQTNSGSFTMYSLPTASYDTAFFEYSVRSGSNARAGTIMAIQSGSAVNFTETTTTDFGSTSAISFTVVVTGSNMALTGSSTSGAWTIKTIIRGI
jgi:hypothetical protein